MQINIQENPVRLGVEAGKKAASLIREAIEKKGNANIILATGASQFETLKQLVREKDIAWDRVTMFHLDEYIGLPESHNASFKKYLKERFLSKVKPLKQAFLIEGTHDPILERKRISELIQGLKIDVALVGIGENGHLAFNDPPADFETVEPFLIVNLDEQCRKQQLGEGWFKDLSEVPEKAISMSVNQIMKSEFIICSVPDGRKAIAIKNCLKGKVTNKAPASILQRHPACFCYLDENSASLIKS